MKKLIILISILSLSFVIFLVIYLLPKSYETTYNIDIYQITEKYFRNEAVYTFTITDGKDAFEFLSETKYRSKRRLISQIKEIKEDKINCILPIIKDEKTYPLCFEDKKLTSFSLIDNADLKKEYPINLTELNDTYKNININNLLDKTYLLWNYRSFYYIKDNKYLEIPLFQKDVYDLSLARMVNNFLFVPNYDSEYKFSEAFIINLDTGNVEKWQLDVEIYFQSYIMGVLDKSIYLFDKKKKIQYELVPSKKKLRKISNNKNAKIYRTTWEDISLNQLVDSEEKFTHFEKYTYELRNDRLYFKPFNTKEWMLVSQVDDIKIITQNEKYIYYLKDDVLYSYNPFLGEVKLLQYFEWNFNYNNMIFIY